MKICYIAAPLRDHASKTMYTKPGFSRIAKTVATKIDSVWTTVSILPMVHTYHKYTNIPILRGLKQKG